MDRVKRMILGLLVLLGKEKLLSNRKCCHLAAEKGGYIQHMKIDSSCLFSTSVWWESVNTGYLILQAPAFVYEGDDVFLRCYSWPGYSVRRTIFYKDGMEFKPSDGNTGLLLPDIKREMSGKYRCAKKTEQSSVTTYTDESFIHVRELFSNPEIKVAPNPVLEGDEMTLTCYTNLSPLRQTRLLFAFYRNGRNVQGLCPSNKYGVRSIKLEDSEKYSCAVETVSRNVRKASPVSYIQVHELFSSPLINVQPNQTMEGDLLSLTCNTSVSRHRWTTELLFAFYMDGGKVQGFNISNTYQIPSVQLKDSGNYSCQVKTSTNNVRKRSQEIHVQVEGTKSVDYELQNLVRLGISSFLFIVWIMLIMWYCKCFRRD